MGSRKSSFKAGKSHDENFHFQVMCGCSVEMGRWTLVDDSCAGVGVEGQVLFLILASRIRMPAAVLLTLVTVSHAGGHGGSSWLLGLFGE